MLLLKKLCIIAFGGSLGAVSRFALISLIHKVFDLTFPLGTLTVNMVGSFVIGFIMVILVQRFIYFESWHLFLVVGFLGAFTTYSSFSFETLTLFQNGAFGYAALNIAVTTLGCLLFVYLGTMLARFI